MNFKIIVHEAAEGGYWADVPALPGRVPQGETIEELVANMREAVEGCLSIDEPPFGAGLVMEIAL